MAIAARIASAAVLATALLGTIAAAAAPATLPGPMPARVERVLDGDTLDVRVQIWLRQEVRVRVRLRGVDAGELRSRCAAERALADQARRWLVEAVTDGRIVLTEIGGGKYHGRVLARAHTPGGLDLGNGLIAAGLARPYDGGRRQGWCSR